jgi:hypothetical protein
MASSRADPPSRPAGGADGNANGRTFAYSLRIGRETPGSVGHQTTVPRQTLVHDTSSMMHDASI